MAEEDDDAGNGSNTVRSPRYPAIGLREAVAKVKAIYDKDKTSGTPTQAVWALMGYSSKSGPAVMALAALKRFGLVEVRNNRAFPTQRAVAIICLPETDQRHKDALAAAAAAPSLYKELLVKYRDTGLPSQESLKHELMLDDRFNHNAIPGLVKDFLASLRYAGLTDQAGVLLRDEKGGSSAMDADSNDEGEDEDVVETVDKFSAGKAKFPAGMSGLKDFPLYTASHKGGLYVPAKMSKKDFNLLKQQIDAYLLVIAATSVAEDEEPE